MDYRWIVVAGCVVATGCSGKVLPSEVTVDGYRVELDAARGPWREGDSGWVEATVFDAETDDPLGPGAVSPTLSFLDGDDVPFLVVEMAAPDEDRFEGEWVHPAAGSWTVELSMTAQRFTPSGQPLTGERIAQVTIH